VVKMLTKGVGNFATKEDRIKNFSIIGAGLGRTGTVSLKMALEILGFGPCYHMISVIKHKQQYIWKSVGDIKASGKQIEWDRVFSGSSIPSFASCVDFPACCYYRELMNYYPNSKVILTVRSPESWYDSFYNTISKISPTHSDYNCCLGAFMWTSPAAYIWDWNESNEGKRFFGTEALSKKENLINAFIEWGEEVKQFVPKERLLVFEARMGWEPLCEFLGVPIPDVPYPNSNKRKSMKIIMIIMLVRSIIWFIFFPIMILINLVEWFLCWWRGGFRDVTKEDTATKQFERIAKDDYITALLAWGLRLLRRIDAEIQFLNGSAWE